MDSYNLSYTLDPEQCKTLSGLARRCRDLIPLCDPVHDAIHAHTHQLVKCRLFVHKKRLLFSCRDINGWGPQELLQYAATANSQAEIDLKLDFLQDAVAHSQGIPFAPEVVKQVPAGGEDAGLLKTERVTVMRPHEQGRTD